MEDGMALVCFIVNIFIPGVGTIINAVTREPTSQKNLIAGIIQLVTSMCLIGWIWSIYWGYLIYQKRKGAAGGNTDGLV